MNRWITRIVGIKKLNSINTILNNYYITISSFFRRNGFRQKMRTKEDVYFPNNSPPTLSENHLFSQEVCFFFQEFLLNWGKQTIELCNKTKSLLNTSLFYGRGRGVENIHPWYTTAVHYAKLTCRSPQFLFKFRFHGDWAGFVVIRR